MFNNYYNPTTAGTNNPAGGDKPQPGHPFQPLATSAFYPAQPHPSVPGGETRNLRAGPRSHPHQDPMSSYYNDPPAFHPSHLPLMTPHEPPPPADRLTYQPAAATHNTPAPTISTIYHQGAVGLPASPSAVNHSHQQQALLSSNNHSPSPTPGVGQQQTQTDQQVAKILEMPPTVLSQLARTRDEANQQRIITQSRLDPHLLPIMRLSAPDPLMMGVHPEHHRSGGPESVASAHSASVRPDGSLVCSSSATPVAAVYPHLQGSAAPVGLSHPAIPHILHQVFTPNSPVILAPVTDHCPHPHEYQPTYRSVDDWAMQVAQQTAAMSSIDHDATQYIASQLKQWALHSQDTQLERHVQQAKQNAVLLAAKAEAVVQTVQSHGGQLAAPISQLNFNSTDFFPDLTPYANTYKSQLATIASGYYTQLHRDAMNKLNQSSPSLDDIRPPTISPASSHHHHHHHPHSHSHPHPHRPPSNNERSSAAIVQFRSQSSQFSLTPSSHPSNGIATPIISTMLTTTLSQSVHPSSVDRQLTTKNVQAAAVAALTANVMAASEIASRASQTLSTLGMNIQADLTASLPPPGPLAIAATQQSLALAHKQQQLPAPTSSSSNIGARPELGALVLVSQPIGSASATTFTSNNPTTSRPPGSHRTHDAALTQSHGSTSGPHRSDHLSPVDSGSRPALSTSTHTPHISRRSSNNTSHQVPNGLSLPHPQNNYAIQVEKMWRSAQEGECTERARDCLLSFAHATYSKKTNDPCLLPLLHTLIKLHPKHLPTLLLLSCVYYSQGDYASALFHNDQILSIDPEYVEAMSNVGTTQRALGKWAEAEQWWWKAVKLRPTYFDAFDNLLGVLCNPQSPAPTSNVGAQPSAQLPPAQPRYSEALHLCTFVETALFGPPEEVMRPLRLPSTIPPSHVHRLQNLFYAKGNLFIANNKALQARVEYEKGLEIVCGTPFTKSPTISPASIPSAHGLVDLVLAVTSIGIYMMALNASPRHSATDPIVLKTLSDTGIWDPNEGSMESVLLDPLKAAQQRRQIVKARLLRMGGGILPCVLMLPEHLDKLVTTVFNAFGKVLPVLQHQLSSSSPHGGAASVEPLRNTAFQSPNQTTSTILLTLAKCLQDVISAPTNPSSNTTLDGIPPSASLLLPLYYVAITLHPSPSTCNNLGILLSTIPSTLTIHNGTQTPKVMNGQQIAHAYYVQGLQKDRNHPHLYTNLGSLLKDMGQLPQAVSMYEKAVQCNPNFDVALANLANAIKDMGRVQESVQWYVRAVTINPNFPEAVCGLVNAMGGVCDWRDRGAVGNEPVVDRNGKLLGPPAPSADGKLRAGLMGKVSRLVDKQLDEGNTYGRGVMRQSAGPEQWLQAISIVKTGRSDGLKPEDRQTWRKKLEVFCGSNDHGTGSSGIAQSKLNEGSFLIRLIERCTRQTQRRWYVDVYGRQITSNQLVAPITNIHQPNSVFKYRRLILPSALPVPPVPTVLPFHTFTYPLTARECRLISHRNALRISLTTLNQPWIPPLVYPPPPPPFIAAGSDALGGLPRLNVGYVSSDFNNHPLSHLMQSVFGLHNQARFKVTCYATTAADGSIYRKKIESEVEIFKDVSGLSHEAIVNEIVKDQIHILVNLNGYTKGARNEIFAARPCPIQMEFMGFAGTLASGWTDWIIADPIVCPPRMVSGEKWRKRHHLKSDSTSDKWEEIPKIVELVEDGPSDFDGDLDPEKLDEDWVYTEKFIYMPHSYFVCDHKQGFREEMNNASDINGVPIHLRMSQGHSGTGQIGDEQPRRMRLWQEEELKRSTMRKELFPDLTSQTVIFANFNQLYKIDPLIFKYWLEILAAVPNSILWLLRFPAPGEPHLKLTAEKWAGREVASRIRFTDVAPKPIHIQRGRVADLFLDSTECNAHTTAADILWSATPILTLPRSTHAHKMCSRVAASIALATGYGSKMIANSMENYKERAVEFGKGLRYQQKVYELEGEHRGREYLSGEMVPGGLIELRHNLFFNREKSVLFDTERWTRNLERGYWEAWRRFVEGLDDEETEEWRTSNDHKLKSSPSIWINEEDEQDEEVRRANSERKEFMKREEENELE